jgi:hypothetical protein
LDGLAGGSISGEVAGVSDEADGAGAAVGVGGAAVVMGVGAASICSEAETMNFGDQNPARTKVYFCRIRKSFPTN